MFLEILPLEDSSNSEEKDTFLKRERLSRILYQKYFFKYPLEISKELILHFGVLEVVKILFSYLKAKIFQRGKSRNLESFFIQRFGRRLYVKFFKSYSEKIWGLPCHEIDASWGAQRVKGISLFELLKEMLDVKKQRDKKHTSLIDNFLYPKHGPGHFWSRVQNEVDSLGGEILFNKEVVEISREEDYWHIKTRDGEWKADYCVSTMPIKSLFRCFNFTVPANVSQAAGGLEYRDFITIGVQLSNLALSKSLSDNQRCNLLKDNWIYIQDSEVKVGRIQIFNNWSPYMVSDPSIPWLGLEYFCQEEDELWNLSDDYLKHLAREELEKIGLIDKKVEVLDHKVVRAKKAYPKYTGSYRDFDCIRDYLLSLDCFYSVGRNGMHRYNNQDHSMVAAMRTAEHLLNETKDKKAAWVVNTEQTYIEER